MQSNEKAPVMEYMQAGFPTRGLTRDEVMQWAETLDAVDQDTAMTAIRELRTTEEFLPSHRRFLGACADIERRTASARALPGPPARGPCGLCGGTGWEPATVASGADAVTRCRCQSAEEPAHPSGCSCLGCHYGAGHAAAITAGMDGAGAWRDEDPLAFVAAATSPAGHDDRDRVATPETARRHLADIRAHLVAWEARDRRVLRQPAGAAP